MVPPLPPSSPDPAADSLAGGEGMDFDALDFTFLDGEDAVLSDAQTAGQSVPAPAADEKPPAPAAMEEDFDLAAWDATETPAAENAEPVAAAPVESPEPALAMDEFAADFGADLALDDDAEEAALSAPEPAVTATASDDPFADLRSPEPDGIDLPEKPQEALGVSFGDEEASTAALDLPEEALDFGADDADFGAEPTAEDAGDAAPETKAPSGPRKYLFDRSFDYVPPPPPAPEPDPEPEIELEPEIEIEPEPEPEPEPEQPPPPPPPTFSEEELAAARTSSYADGETAGLQAAMATIEARSARAVEAIAQQVPGVLADRHLVVSAIAQEAARLAYALVARMMPELARTYGLGEIEAVVRDSLSMAVDQPRLSIRVHPDIAAQLQPKLEIMAINAGFNGQITLLADAALGPSDVRVEWGDGGAERLVARAWDDVTEIVRHSVADLKERTGAGVADETALVQGCETASL